MCIRDRSLVVQVITLFTTILSKTNFIMFLATTRFLTSLFLLRSSSKTGSGGPVYFYMSQTFGLVCVRILNLQSFLSSLYMLLELTVWLSAQYLNNFIEYNLASVYISSDLIYSLINDIKQELCQRTTLLTKWVIEYRCVTTTPFI